MNIDSSFEFRHSSFPFRVGHGFDLHRLEAGRQLVVGGVHVDHDRGAAGHSDGDVVYHAVTDAILGALAQPDIGQLFPDTDQQWKDADSKVFIAEADRIMRRRGYEIGNLDITVICQRPKLSPHKDQMRKNIAFLLGCDIDQVNVKGKTHEKVDAIGKGSAIACHVVVLLVSAASIG